MEAERVKVDDDPDGMDERYKINHRALALDLVRARRARHLAHRPSWDQLFRHGYWRFGFRGWKGKPRWGRFAFYHDGDWYVSFHLGSAWIECSTTP